MKEKSIYRLSTSEFVSYCNAEIQFLDSELYVRNKSVEIKIPYREIRYVSIVNKGFGVVKDVRIEKADGTKYYIQFPDACHYLQKILDVAPAAELCAKVKSPLKFHLIKIILWALYFVLAFFFIWAEETYGSSWTFARLALIFFTVTIPIQFYFSCSIHHYSKHLLKLPKRNLTLLLWLVPFVGILLIDYYFIRQTSVCLKEDKIKTNHPIHQKIYLFLLVFVFLWFGIGAIYHTHYLIQNVTLDQIMGLHENPRLFAYVITDLFFILSALFSFLVFVLRVARLSTAPLLTCFLNCWLLFQIPLGTVVGIYGLWKVDKATKPPKNDEHQNITPQTGHLAVLRSIWGALCSSHLFFFIVLLTLSPEYKSPKNLEYILFSLVPILWIGIFSYYWQNTRLAQVKEKINKFCQEGHDKEETLLLMKVSFQNVYILSWSLCEAITLYVLVLGALGKIKIIECVLFMLSALILQCLMYPRLNHLSGIIESEYIDGNRSSIRPRGR